MAINSVGLDPKSGVCERRASFREMQQDFGQLVQALQAGNLDAAQKAYGSIQQITAASSTAAPSTAPAAPASLLASDWAALGQSLQSGDVAASQNAIGKAQQDAVTAAQAQFQRQLQNAYSVYALLQNAMSGGTMAAAPSTVTSGTGQAQNPGNNPNSAVFGIANAAGGASALPQPGVQALNQAGGHHGHHRHHGRGALHDIQNSTGLTTAASTTSAAPELQQNTSGATTSTAPTSPA